MIEFLNKLSSFGSFLSSNIWWVVGGLAVGLVIILVLWACLKTIPNTFLCILIVILTLTFSLGICSLINKKVVEDDFSNPSNQELAEELDKGIKANWGNSNGGWTFEQIHKAQNDDDCPKLNDVVLNIDVKDFGGYVSFYFYDGKDYQNAVFLKTENGLIYDGMLNASCGLDVVMKWYSWLSLGAFKEYDLNSFQWYFEKDKEPYYFERARTNQLGLNFGSGNYNDMVSQSLKTLNFSRNNFPSRYTNSSDAKSLTWKNANSLLYRNINTYFSKFDDVELIGTKDNATIAINSFYNHIWEQVKGLAFGSSKLIDVSELMCVPIAEELKTNFPISADKKAEYDNADYYSVYRLNIAVNCQVTQGNKQVNENNNVDDYLKDNSDNDVTKVETHDTGVTYSLINVKFNNKDDVNIDSVDLVKTPIIITFTNKEINTTKTLIINSKRKLEVVNPVLLAKGYEWTYTIQSQQILFDGYSGSFLTDNTLNNLTLDYTFLNGYVVASVGLNPIKDVDISLIDLSSNPVKIILSNDKQTYQFVFDNNSKLNSSLTQIVEIGKYEYIILSEQLIFASISGEIDITAVDNFMLFNFAVNLNSGDLQFKINLTQTLKRNYDVYLSASSSVVDIIRNDLSSSQKYNVIIIIYDESGKIIEQFTHLHQSSGSCSDSWNTNNLNNGAHYIAQVRFVDYENSTKTYLSDIIEFDYNSLNSYTFEYNANIIE